jgi:predicted GH43/DUF377 family glycosyl hydrolase
VSVSDRTHGVVFTADELLPEAWRRLAQGSPVRTFNPGLLRNGDGWLLAYRVVLADGIRRIGLCHLSASLQIIAGSQIPLSDSLRVVGHDYPDIARSWFADPRLYRFDDRVFIYWNTGWHEPQNHQFLQELDPVSMAPIGRARELLVRGFERQKLEKNWTLFSTSSANLFAVYSITPHRVLAGSLHNFQDDREVEFEQIALEPMTLDGYPVSHGGLRGGTPPQRAGDGFVSFCHSVHDGANGYRYTAAAYKFSATAPFAPTKRPAATLELHNPFGEERTYPALNPAVSEVLYPCGAARDDDRWLVSHGINDEHCALSFVPDSAIEATLTPMV